MSALSSRVSISSLRGAGLDLWLGFCSRQHARECLATSSALTNSRPQTGQMYRSIFFIAVVPELGVIPAITAENSALWRFAANDKYWEYAPTAIALKPVFHMKPPICIDVVLTAYNGRPLGCFSFGEQGYWFDDATINPFSHLAGLARFELANTGVWWEKRVLPTHLLQKGNCPNFCTTLPKSRALPLGDSPI